MKLVDVPFGNQTGRSFTLTTYWSGLNVGDTYQIIAHKMDEASFSGKHYFLVKNSSGDDVLVPTGVFGF